MRVLFTSPVLEHPPAGGPELRIENSIKALSGICNLNIMVRNEKKYIGGDQAELFYKSYCEEFSYSTGYERISDNRYIRKLQRLLNNYFENDLEAILKYLDNKKIDVIWFGFGNISFPLIKKIKQKRPSQKIVCDTDSVWSRFILRELPYERDPKRRAKIEKEGYKKEKEEKEWVNICDVTTAVSEVDADYYRGLANNKDKIKIFSNVIDIDSYKEIPVPPKNYKNPCVYLAGTFGHNSPMEQGALWFINKVLPIIRAKIPDIHFYIVGKGSTEVFKEIRNQNITITGKLESVLPYLCNADVTIVPLWFESGTRFKILEAGACTKAVVSTSLGAEGLPVTNEKDILIADDIHLFADAVVQLVKNKVFANEISDNLNLLVSTNYSIKALEIEAMKILDYLMSN